MSEEKGKGISLRRKKTTRPTISAPREMSRPRDRSADAQWDASTTASSATNVSISREARSNLGGGAKTSDLVKRRYSTRFGAGGTLPTHSNDGLTPPVPTMPSLPAQYAHQNRRDEPRNPSRDGRSPSRDGGGRLKVDLSVLKDPSLQVDKYVQSLLADASESDIRTYQNELQNVKAHANSDLQHNVYQNRTQFIKISKEADKLKSEMRTLRTLMVELTGALGHATNAGGADVSGIGANGSTLSVADRKRANRSSVANLEAMWSSHLQTLWKRVEGSQKYLPALPGRHIIMESQRWVELNAATWKPRRRVALVLLNDHVLVASEKKRNDLIVQAQNDAKNKRQSVYQPSSSSGTSQSQTMLVAERCWALQDVTLADISMARGSAPMSGGGPPPGSKQHSAMSNAINIRAGNESFTYATADTAEKAGLVVAFRKAQEDLRKQMAVEHGEREKVFDEFASLTDRDPRLLKKVAADQAEQDHASSGGLNRSSSILIDAEGRQQSIRSVESQIDTLDIDIALQHFEDAVARVEKLRKLVKSIRSNATASEIIQAKINERASRLASSIARQLIQTSSSMEKTKENVSWLLRLGFEEMARTRYLDSRTETIRVRTRQLPFTGALSPYIHALSFTTFTLLLHTFRTFSSSFPPVSGSAVVKWAKERVDEFNEHLTRHISTVDRGTDLWNQCVDVAREQAGTLSEVGVDFRGLVARDLIGGEEEASAKETDKQDRRQKRSGVGLGVSDS